MRGGRQERTDASGAFLRLPCRFLPASLMPRYLCAALVCAALASAAPAHSQRVHAPAPHIQPRPSSPQPSSHSPAVTSRPPQPRSVEGRGSVPNSFQPPAQYPSQNTPRSGNFGAVHNGPPGPSRPLITAQPPRTGSYPSFRAPYTGSIPAGNQPRSNPNQHLPSWLATHRGESFQDQERSLQREPGFSHLPQGQQQRLVDRLHQLDAMPPARRQRTLDRIENMERLSPQRRQAVRTAAQQLQTMPPARKQQVQSAFRSLRDLSPAQRQQALNSPQYRSRYTSTERGVLNSLLSVEPYEPRGLGAPPPQP